MGYNFVIQRVISHFASENRIVVSFMAGILFQNNNIHKILKFVEPYYRNFLFLSTLSYHLEGYITVASHENGYLNSRRWNHAEVQLAKWSVAIPVGIKKKKKHKRTSYMHTEYVHKVFQNCMWGIVLYSECLTDASYLYLTTQAWCLFWL